MREYYEAVLEDLKRVKLQTEQAIEALEKLADLHGPRVQAAPSKLMAAAYPAAYDAPVSNNQAFQEAYAGTGFPPAPRPTPMPLPLADWEKDHLKSLEEKYPALDGHELGEYLDLRHRFDYPQYKEEQAEKKKAAAPIPADPAPSTARPDTQNQTLMEEAQALLDNLEPESPIS